MAITLSTLRGTPAYGKDASTGNQWLSSGVLTPGSSTAFDLPNGGSITTRVRTTTTSTAVMFGNDNGQSSGTFWVGVQNGYASIAPGNGTTGTMNSTTTINDGAWHTITLNATSSGLEFLVDGTRVAYKDSSANPYTPIKVPFVWGKGSTAIGGLGTYTQFDWSGDIDYFKVTDNTGATVFSTDFSDAVVSPVAVTASAAQTVAAGSSATLGATATGGSGTYTYSWAQTSGASVTLSSTTAKAPTFTAPSAAATLGFTVTASDGSGTATASTTVTVNAPVATADTTAPTAPTVTAGAVTTSSVTVTVSGGTDAVGVTQYRAMVNGGSWQTRTGAGDITISGLTAGTSYTVSAQAGDAAGNWSPLATVSTTTTAATTTTQQPSGTTTGTTTTGAPAEAFVQFKHLSGVASKLTVVTMTGSASYDPATLGASSSQVAAVMFVQPTAGGATATVNGAALNLNTAANARTLVEIVPTASGYAVLYPTTTLVSPYPTRPPLAPGCVRYKGAAQPSDWLTNDTWEQTS